MKPKFSPLLLIPSLSAALVGCATPNAPEYGGRWRPVNRFPEAPLEIALHQSYRFYASPLDGTLKTMLERWAGDSKMKLDYQAPVDYTLHVAVAELSSKDLKDATTHLSAIYAAQNLVVSVESNHIVVRALEAARTSSTAVSP